MSKMHYIAHSFEVDGRALLLIFNACCRMKTKYQEMFSGKLRAVKLMQAHGSAWAVGVFVALLPVVIVVAALGLRRTA